MVKVVPFRKPYRGGPSITGGGAVSCPGGNGGTTKARASLVANSPSESRALDELIALQSGRRPRDLPGWSSLVVGPALRGTEVSLR